MGWQDSDEAKRKRGIPEGLWVRCPGCQATIFRKAARRLLDTCPECGYHWPVSAPDRIAQTLDDGTFEEWDADLVTADPLNFCWDRKTYKDRIKADRQKTGLKEAIITGSGRIRARKVAIGVLDSRFIMGSMGSVVGEKIVRLMERAREQRLPLIIFSGSGGARMHEGIISLMQMPKTTAALAFYRESGGLFVSVLTNPTMGGVTASYSSLGDLVFAEPNALIGFAGPRTIAATIRAELPKGFQSSEFQSQHGFVDRIVKRQDMKTELARAIDYCRMV